ncbi:RidA family protein [uncultured Maribacter sp.]|uniref:RidA family protein n=1 Tax=uncultured Maribacter sp. TaxID=431308 RepID=UPI00260D4BE0|nr:RidA family protein [uncultured Maribacter sp.]
MKYCVLVLLTAVILSCGDVNKPANTENETTSAHADTNYNPEAILDSLGIVLRDQGIPVANYVHVARTGNLLFLAGKGPKQANGENIIGKLGDSLTIDQGYQAAREVGINQLSVLKAELGNLNKVKRIVSVHGMVNASPDFKDHSKVINGYSDLMVAVFGEKGKHARAAVGMGSLPGNMAVEVEMVVEVYE